MSNNKSLYQLLKQKGHILKEEITKLQRSREKAVGFMWDGEMTITTKDNLKIYLTLWYHVFEDEGEHHWRPTLELLEQHWRPSGIPKEPSPTAVFGDPAWCILYVDDHVYMHKNGWFGLNPFTGEAEKLKAALTASVKDGSWVNNQDLWCVV